MTYKYSFHMNMSSKGDTGLLLILFVELLRSPAVNFNISITPTSTSSISFIEIRTPIEIKEFDDILQ